MEDIFLVFYKIGKSHEFLMKNILFIAPHPDDELVGATFIIKKVLLKKSYYFFSNKIYQKMRCGFGIKKI